MAIYFTSDQHWFHNNILNIEDRPYNSIDEMNQNLIDVWNDTVKPHDYVHHLGDFCFGGYERWTSILDQLNGKIILYKGNHDKSNVLKRLVKNGYFEDVHKVGDIIKINKMQLYLTHYPMEIGLRPNKFSISGHIHSKRNSMLNQINVGIDSPLNFNREFGKPISEDELIIYLEYLKPFIEDKNRLKELVKNDDFR